MSLPFTNSDSCVLNHHTRRVGGRPLLLTNGRIGTIRIRFYKRLKVKEGVVLCGWIPAAELGNDVVEVLLRAEALALQYFHNGGSLPHSGDSGFFDGHGFTLGAVVIYDYLERRR